MSSWPPAMSIHCHLHPAVTSPVTGATVNRIIIAGHLPYQIKRNQISELFNIHTCWKRHISSIVVCCRCIFGCHVTYLPITAGEATVWTSLPRQITAASRIHIHFIHRTNYYVPPPPPPPPHTHTHTHTQSNLPIVNIGPGNCLSPNRHYPSQCWLNVN